MTFLYPNATRDDLPEILQKPELANCTIINIRYTQVESFDEVTMTEIKYPRVEIDAEFNGAGQVILPSVQERMQAAETLINLILDEEAI